MHVANLLDLCSLHLKWKRSTGMPHSVHHVRIDIAERVLVRDHFAAAGEADRRSVLLRGCTLQRLAVAFVRAGTSRGTSPRRHAEAAAELNMVAAREILLLLLLLQPPRHVHVHAAEAVAVVFGIPSSAGTWPLRLKPVVGQVAPDHAGRVREAVANSPAASNSAAAAPIRRRWPPPPPPGSGPAFPCASPYRHTRRLSLCRRRP